MSDEPTLQGEPTTMADATSRELFLNLPVRDLKQSMAFFEALGFTFNSQFTDANAACMVVSDKAFVMLLTEPFFRTFTTRPLCDTSAAGEGIFAVSCPSRADVDRMVETAVASGGRDTGISQDHGFMFFRSFYDLDGHNWEVLWMDPAAVQ
jgi:hypothetical protein